MLSTDATQAVKWPKVPACYGWLSLSSRGIWRLQSQPITHHGLIAFINSHYGPDKLGNWVFQNGPQTVYVALEYTPYVYRLDPPDRLTAHTGVLAGNVVGVYLDEKGSILIQTDLGPGLLDDRDLSEFLGNCVTASKQPALEDDLLAAMAGTPGVSWNDLPLQAILRHDVPQLFGFQPRPVP